jgi:hypothetical protein
MSRHFWQSQFDKLLLSILFLVLLGTSVFSPTTAEWTQRIADTAFGALIGIITGRAMARAGDRKQEEKRED